jgi:hydrogenase maturation protease
MPDLVPKPKGRGKPTLVIGLGNPLMGDDGVGLVVLDQLAAQSFMPPVEFVDGGTWGLALLPDVERAGALLLLDAVNGDGAPGTIYVLGAEEIPRFLAAKLSPHQVDVRELLALAELRGELPSNLRVVGVQPAATAYGDGLSPEAAAAAVEAMVAAAGAVLSGWGHSATARPAGA